MHDASGQPHLKRRPLLDPLDAIDVQLIGDGSGRDILFTPFATWTIDASHFDQVRRQSIDALAIEIHCSFADGS
ncbi:hypothetical protein [Allosphingosinicella deserti]|uniref:hypothetical protein n=1 Tax=Allosphingosinicella deserti TaxID=2116704 RepID=UPI001304AE32|nr:hypothetical protein [Sphingomonas deserti]